MCGICGVVQVGGAPRAVLPPSTLDHMTDLMTHRGPSARGTYFAEGIALGVRRLSIVDVEGGDQPAWSEDGSVVAVQNGELYNHMALRHAYPSHSYASRCDTEVIPHLYEELGTAFPERLRGMFGIAVWDAPRRRLVLARDRLGIKPLYYARAGDLLVFASELKSLLASGLVEPVLDYEAIDAYLTLGYFPAPQTPLAGVSKLLPGSVLVVDSDVRVERFWRYPAAAPEEMTLDDAAERLTAKLDESVRLRLMSDVPLGAMVSGGLDSSLILALMARNMTDPVKTFAIGFAEDPESELQDARNVARAFGADHTEVELSFGDASIPLEELLWHLDEPVGDLSTLGFHALCRIAAADVTVALSGQGADELFGGYRKHRAAWAAMRLGRLPRAARDLARRAAPVRLDSVRRMARVVAAGDAAGRLLGMSADVDPSLRNVLYRGPLRLVDGDAARRAITARLDGKAMDPLAETLYLDAQLALPDLMLHYFDRASMAHSLEVRVPFLDHELVELAATIPTAHKVRLRGSKVVLRHLAAGMLPESVLKKKKVGFFVGASDAWLHRQLSSQSREWLVNGHLVREGLLHGPAVAELAEEFATRGAGAPRARLLLSVLMLEVWLASYLPRARRLAGDR